MRFSFQTGAILLALALPADSLRAQAPPLDRGKVLLLDNDRILEGDIERMGSGYRIRRSVGELWIPADKAKRLCRDVDEAFRLMQLQANLRDPDERLRLARWCQVNGLKDKALEEARAALEMRPDHAETMQMVHVLQRVMLPNLTSQPTPTPAAPKTPPPKTASPAMDVSQETFVQFSSKVQPILMNACYSCHQAGKGTTLQFHRPGDGGFRTAAQRNLNAALAFVNLERPTLSPLLIKSVVAHGGASAAPLKGRQSTPFQTLQSWLEQLAATNPHLRELQHAETGPATGFGTRTSAKRSFDEDGRGIAVVVPVTSPRVPAVPMPPPPPPGARDPFDAEEFNRQRDPRRP
jgi:hypothetical protein